MAADHQPALTTAQVAERLGFKTTEPVLRLARSGELQGRQIGKGRWRFSPAAVETFLLGAPSRDQRAAEAGANARRKRAGIMDGVPRTVR